MDNPEINHSSEKNLILELAVRISGILRLSGMEWEDQRKVLEAAAFLACPVRYFSE